jgi:hypothetical protein
MDNFICLLVEERVGMITNLRLQEKFPLTSSEKSISYIADFVYFSNEYKTWVIHEAKGKETRLFLLKWQLMQEQYPQFKFILQKKGS